jgi:penicillin-insensitive murein DD-endopeptidase
LCREAGSNRAWLAKVRPWLGHDYHFHVRIFCPPDSPKCEPQPPPDGNEGCGPHDLDSWFTESMLHPQFSSAPQKPGLGLTMAKLPPGCREVLVAP